MSLASQQCREPSVEGARPNLLWICTDQQRYDTIHSLNNPHVKTPNLDRLCAEGVAFSHAFCQNPTCTPSRASFLTGLYPSTLRVNRNGMPDFPENARVRLITRRLADAGYDCGLAGKLHLASAWNGVEKRTADGYRRFWYSHSPWQGIGRGNQYTDWLQSLGVDLADVFVQRPDGSYGAYRPDVQPGLHQTTWCADRAIEFIREERQGPWLMSVNIFDPHSPFDAPEAYSSHYDAHRLPPPLFRESDLEVQARLSGAFFQSGCRPPDEAIQRNKASYYGMVELIDEQVGRMIRALEETGHRDDTVIIYTSDHGEMLGDHGLTGKGCRFYEGTVRVPLIVSWPGHFRGGLAADGLVELTDLAPTLADLAGVPLEWTHGRSLVPILTGRVDPHHFREAVRCEYYDSLDMLAPQEPRQHTPCWATMYRDERYKLVVYHGLEYGELYDLEQDPGEFRNLWQLPEMAACKLDLMKRSFDANIVVTDPGPSLIGRY